jgi:hypothetical protein
MNATRLVSSINESQRITDEILGKLIKADEAQAASFMTQLIFAYSKKVQLINEKHELIENWNMGLVEKSDYENRLA